MDLETNGYYLHYQNEKLDISEVYIQDLLANPNLFYSIDNIDSQVLFRVIEIHVNAIKIKERELENKVRRLNEYEYSNNYHYNR